MYFGTAPFWSGGHASAGVAAPAPRWFFAEGATGDFFDTYLLVANPNDSAANVTYEYLLPDGTVITESRSVLGNSRFTVNVEAQHASLRNTAVSTVISSDLPIVAERAMYWPGPSTTWYEAHNSFGLTTIGTKWGVAEGRVGQARGYKTYILLSNPGTAPAAVTVTYVRTSGPSVVKSYTVAPTSRFNVDVAALVPELRDESFGAVIESSQEIAVERALYWNADGVFWAAGTNVTATRLP